MKCNNPMRVLVVFVSLVLVLNFLSLTPPVKGQGYEGVRIKDVEVKIENRTGMFFFLFQVEGTAPVWTDHVNVSLGYSNSTARESLGFWIEPVDMMLFGNGISLVPTGEGKDNWTSWKMKVGLNIPMNENPGSVLALFAGLFGLNLSGSTPLDGLQNIRSLEDLEKLEGVDDILNLTGLTNISDLMDPVELFKLLADTKVLVIARGVDREGIFTEDEKDIKFELIGAIFDFLESEGIIDDGTDLPDDTDDTPNNGEGSDNGDDTVLYIMLGISILLFIGIIVLSVFIFTIKREE